MINYDLRKIKTIIFDVDGVLSASTIPMDNEGTPVRTVNIKDGYAMHLALKMGLKLAIITGGTTESVRRRYEILGMKDVYLGCSRKIETYRRYMDENNLKDEEAIYVGDDIPDYEVMRTVGCACCPNDACAEIRAISTYVSPCDGGYGCGRDIIEQVLKAQGKWMTGDKAFGW